MGNASIFARELGDALLMVNLIYSPAKMLEGMHPPSHTVDVPGFITAKQRKVTDK